MIGRGPRDSRAATGKDRKLSAEPVTDPQGADAVRGAALVIMQLALFADEEAKSGLRAFLTNLAGLLAPAEES